MGKRNTPGKKCEIFQNYGSRNLRTLPCRQSRLSESKRIKFTVIKKPNCRKHAPDANNIYINEWEATHCTHYSFELAARGFRGASCNVSKQRKYCPPVPFFGFKSLYLFKIPYDQAKEWIVPQKIKNDASPLKNNTQLDKSLENFNDHTNTSDKKSACIPRVNMESISSDMKKDKTNQVFEEPKQEKIKFETCDTKKKNNIKK